jgi:hypothetical protein
MERLTLEPDEWSSSPQIVSRMDVLRTEQETKTDVNKK